MYRVIKPSAGGATNQIELLKTGLHQLLQHHSQPWLVPSDDLSFPAGNQREQCPSIAPQRGMIEIGGVVGQGSWPEEVVGDVYDSKNRTRAKSYDPGLSHRPHRSCAPGL